MDTVGGGGWRRGWGERWSGEILVFFSFCLYHLANYSYCSMERCISTGTKPKDTYVSPGLCEHQLFVGWLLKISAVHHTYQQLVRSGTGETVTNGYQRETYNQQKLLLKLSIVVIRSHLAVSQHISNYKYLFSYCHV